MPQSRPFSPEHQHDTALQVDLMGPLRAFGIGAHDPKTCLLEQLQCPHQIGNRYHRSRFSGAHCHLSHGCGQLSCAITRHDDGECAACVSCTQACTEVM